MNNDIKVLQQQIKYDFRDVSKLKLALTHRSVGSKNNERYEFLGDSILSFVIAAELFERMESSSEGDLSRFRSSLVKKESLAERARAINLGDYLFLGGGELKSGGFRRDSTLADAFEAVLGAVYLDGGFEECKKMILFLFHDALDQLLGNGVLKDPKTRLQEFLQAFHLALPVYTLESVTGKDHEQQFEIRCATDCNDIISTGISFSRRGAEQNAAAKMLEILKQLDMTGKKV